MLDNIDKPILISFSICPFVQRSAIVLENKGQAYKRINIDLANKPDWFMQLSPTGKVPMLAIEDKGETRHIFESSVINEYLDETLGKPMLSQAPLQRAQERAFIAYSEQLLMQQYRLMLVTTANDFREALDAFIDALLKLQVPEDTENLTLLDAAIAPLFQRIQITPSIDTKLQSALSSEHPLMAWMLKLIADPAVIKSTEAGFNDDYYRYFNDLGSYALQI